MTGTRSHLTLGEAAITMSVLEHHIRKGISRGVITPQRFGRYAMFPVADLQSIREALERAGIVRSTTAPEPGASDLPRDEVARAAIG
ncbi:MAG: hypothetical protein JWO38_6279 [Gemmataceae bacterium]|nr:hypothetical protein [Gemmataceae bacterium]